jgi:hypothetical protein
MAPTPRNQWAQKESSRSQPTLICSVELSFHVGIPVVAGDAGNDRLESGLLGPSTSRVTFAARIGTVPADDCKSLSEFDGRLWELVDFESSAVAARSGIEDDPFEDDSPVN